VEEPLEIRVGDDTPDGRRESSISITMRTPGNDADLAAGFLFTESIIRDTSDIAFVKPCGPPAPDSGNTNVVRVELESGVDVDLDRLERHFYTTSSCGVCGKTSIDALRVSGAKEPATDKTRFDRKILTALPDKLRAAQKIFDETGGLHAAAAFNSAGELVVIHEDVGRHNALDKLIGWGVKNDQLSNDGLVIMTSRASYEIVQKAAACGISMIAAVSGPTGMAVRLAKELGVTLIGFARNNSLCVYSHPERLL